MSISHGQNVFLTDAKRNKCIFTGFGVPLAPKTDPKQLTSPRQKDVLTWEKDVLGGAARPLNGDAGTSSDLPSLLLASLHPASRKQVKQSLAALSATPGFIGALLQLVLGQGTQDCSVHFRGRVSQSRFLSRTRWSEEGAGARDAAPLRAGGQDLPRTGRRETVRFMSSTFPSAGPTSSTNEQLLSLTNMSTNASASRPRISSSRPRPPHPPRRALLRDQLRHLERALITPSPPSTARLPTPDLFGSEQTIEGLVQGFVVPNVGLREHEMDQFEDIPLEFIRLDLRGVSRGVTSTNRLVGVVKFFPDHIFEDLLAMVEPILQVEAIRLVIDDDIDDLIQRGEARTTELNSKYEGSNLDDLNNFKSDATVQ
ncbi:hypothetical protein FIBSPDRAFT_958084 [Athelia psychrophila]|uniref:Exportin-2 central domain-containing protein n=1 Tax=Athelia psychrophila TaxID=1759441 RepID=A0A166F2D2_9AGAM|nr:hypothetical protein FIBSPDRAFT_958084 [Fibularhizoctonia sp. CBS 109695]